MTSSRTMVAESGLEIFEIAPHTPVEWVIVVAFSFPVIIIGACACSLDCQGPFSYIHSCDIECIDVGKLSFTARHADEVLKAVGRGMNAKERAARLAAMEEAKKKA